MKDQIQRVILDADDTLWENNIFYIEAEKEISDLICSAGFNKKELRKKFVEIEHRIVREHGYGCKNFIIILNEIYNLYQNRNGSQLDQARFKKLISEFEKHPNRKPRLFPDVFETLELLKKRYDLYILTKGNYQEQYNKIILSGVLDHIDDFFIPPEKNDFSYRELLQQKGWTAETSCMVGNSPKSDINPALRVGMYAVFIPYKYTWYMDTEAVEKSSERLYQIEKFNQLTDIL